MRLILYFLVKTFKSRANVDGLQLTYTIFLASTANKFLASGPRPTRGGSTIATSKLIPFFFQRGTILLASPAT